MGNLKRDINKFEDAINLYQKALKLDKKNPIIFYCLALAYQGLGKFEEAIEYAEKTLNIEKFFTQADHLISQSMKYENKNEHYCGLIEKLKNKDLNNQQRVDIHFSMAKAEEDMGKIKEAVININRGNNFKSKLLNYKIESDIKLFEDLKFKFKDIKFNDSSDQNDENIIFILGMPRSGTSLVEQIISSHSNVIGAGELPILSKIVKDNFINNNRLNINQFDEIMNSQNKVQKLKNDYKNFIQYFDVKENFITDKAPLNFRWIGFIKKILPGSKIVHCTRDIKDNCLSMYKNLFEGGLGFTYNQEDLVKYYHNYTELMKFWKFLFGDTIYEMKYEKLISNKDEEIKKLINFCQLKWDDKCLMFHKNKTPIKTMSTAQARKPIYNSSLNTFDKFRKYLLILDKNL